MTSRIYLVSMDGEIYQVTLQTAEGAFNAKGELEVEQSKVKTQRLTPAAAKPDFDALLPELLTLRRLIHA
jgi:hypothetical protein